MSLASQHRHRRSIRNGKIEISFSKWRQSIRTNTKKPSASTDDQTAKALISSFDRQEDARATLNLPMFIDYVETTDVSHCEVVGPIGRRRQIFIIFNQSTNPWQSQWLIMPTISRKLNYWRRFGCRGRKSLHCAILITVWWKINHD